MENKTIIRVQKAPEGFEARYVALTSSGDFILGFRKLGEIRERYKHFKDVEIVRELDKTYRPRG